MCMCTFISQIHTWPTLFSGYSLDPVNSAAVANHGVFSCTIEINITNESGITSYNILLCFILHWFQN